METITNRPLTKLQRQEDFDQQAGIAKYHLATFRLLHAELLAFLMTCTLAGCGTLHTLEPSTLPIELVHVSHLTQHAPFTSDPHSYGYNAVMAGARWNLPAHFSVTLEEGLNVQRQHSDYCGSLRGPRELFTGRITYEVPLK